MENKEEIPAIQPAQMNLSDIAIVEPKQVIDVDKYEGTRVKIAKVEMQWVDSHYINGEYAPDTTEKAPFLFVETEALDNIPQQDGTTKPLVVKQRFSLQKGENGKPVISKHSKAKLWKFMRKYGANTPQELVGRIVSITTEPSKNPDDDRKWLRIVC